MSTADAALRTVVFGLAEVRIARRHLVTPQWLGQDVHAPWDVQTRRVYMYKYTVVESCTGPFFSRESLSTLNYTFSKLCLCEMLTITVGRYRLLAVVWQVSDLPTSWQV